MRLTAYRDFQKAMERILLLYEATMHSYALMYEEGKNELRKSEESFPRIKFKRGNKVVPRSLKIVTYHARDVYPELLRSTLLIRMVSAYEVFLVDCIEEVSGRSSKPFYTDARVEFSQEQLLTIDSGEGIYKHLVKKTTRRLTSGGLKDTRKFYQRQLGTDLTPDSGIMDAIEEIHDRRHIYVHRAGYADAEYVAKHPKANGVVDGLLHVTDEYLLEALTVLGGSAMYIKKALEALFPESRQRSYVSGDLNFPQQPECLNFFSVRVLKAEGRAGLTDLSLVIEPGVTLKNITAWLSHDGQTVRMLVGTTASKISSLSKALRGLEVAGVLKIADSFKIKR